MNKINHEGRKIYLNVTTVSKLFKTNRTRACRLLHGWAKNQTYQMLSHKKGNSTHFLDAIMARRGGNPRNGEVRDAIVPESNGDYVPRSVTRTPSSAEETSVSRSELASDAEDSRSNSSAEVIRDLKRKVDELEKKLHDKEIDQIKWIGRSHKQMKRDPRMFRKIYKVVSEKIFPCKKFIVGQTDLDDFIPENSMGHIIMGMLKIEDPDRLPFWGCYKEIVADAIANRRTTITNDLKKIVMSK